MAKSSKKLRESDEKPISASATRKTEKNPNSLANLKMWAPGQSGNPVGRQKGSRNKLAEDFLRDLHEAWVTKGKEAIERVIADRPQDFLKVVAGILPKEIKIKDELSEFSDEQLAALNALAIALIGDDPVDHEEDRLGAGAKAIN